MDRPGLVEIQEELDHLAHLGQWGHQDLSDHLVHLVLQDQVDNQETLEVLDFRDKRDNQDLLDQLVTLDHLVRLVNRGHLARWVHQVSLDHRVSRVHRVQLDHPELPVRLDRQGESDRRASLVLQATQDHRVPVALLDHRAMQDHQDFQGCRENTVVPEVRELQVHKDPPDLLDLLDQRGLWGQPVRVETKDLLEM